MIAMPGLVQQVIVFVVLQLFPGAFTGNVKYSLTTINRCIWYYFFTTVTLTSSADSVCPGDTVVFTCVTDTAPLVWSISVNEHVKVYYSSDQVNQPAVTIGGILTVKLVNTTGKFESTATAYNDSDEVNITCSNDISEAYSNIRSITIGEN